MKKSTTSPAAVPTAIVEEAWQQVSVSFERFCLTAGIATLTRMLEEDADGLCGPRYDHGDGKDGHRWGKTKGKVGFHGGKVEVERPRVRTRQGGEISLPSWKAAQSEDLLSKWALSQMLINISTRKFGRSVRLPEGDIPVVKGTGVSKSAVSRRFVALSAERLKDWMAADLSRLDLRIIQIDGIHIEEDLMLLAAVGIDGGGVKHPLGVLEGATENTAVVQALLDNLVERGLDPAVCRLFVVDGAKALTKAIRNTFGQHTPIQRCQVHKARNITDRLAKPLHASVRNGLPVELRRSLACTNIIENMNGTNRQVCRNVKRWRDTRMALRWTGAAMQKAAKGFRRLKAHKQLPTLRAALIAHQVKHSINPDLEQRAKAA